MTPEQVDDYCSEPADDDRPISNFEIDRRVNRKQREKEENEKAAKSI
jgi:hypothetical protein